ncbi:MAG: hypothetical protein GDA40_12325 [Rhodobacteraceae bacterium]|nr:hypothetical protein [Paracoccaceae bacterium]
MVALFKTMTWEDWTVIKRAALIGALMFGAATPGMARELLDWGAVEGWNIMINPAAGDGCMMERQFEDGTLFQLGAIPAERGGFFAVYNRDWTWIEDGATGPIHFQFEDKKFGGEAYGKVSGKWYGGFAYFNNPDLAYDFARKASVTISNDDGQSVVVDLTGSEKALDMVIQCQAEQG